MNKLIHILFTFYFTLVSSGVLYSKHSCGESVSHSVYGISIDSGSKCCCSHDSAEHDKGCCESETTVLKAETQKLSAKNHVTIWNPLELNLFYTHTLELYCNEFKELTRVISFVHPPPKPPTPLFILNNNLLI